MPFFKRKQKESINGGGLVLFDEVQEAMKAERILKQSDYTVKLVAPPPELREGCDLAVEINLIEQPGVERMLKDKGVIYSRIAQFKADITELLDIVKVTDFGRWIMIKAANMKLSIEKESGIIVNVSGGGCPDIPYLHSELLGKSITEAPKPGDIGFTLCALMLERALNESLVLMKESK